MAIAKPGLVVAASNQAGTFDLKSSTTCVIKAGSFLILCWDCWDWDESAVIEIGIVNKNRKAKVIRVFFLKCFNGCYSFQYIYGIRLYIKYGLASEDRVKDAYSGRK
jgi:hypothetical protein